MPLTLLYTVTVLILPVPVFAVAHRHRGVKVALIEPGAVLLFFAGLLVDAINPITSIM